MNREGKGKNAVSMWSMQSYIWPFPGLKTGNLWQCQGDLKFCICTSLDAHCLDQMKLLWNWEVFVEGLNAYFKLVTTAYNIV